MQSKTENEEQDNADESEKETGNDDGDERGTAPWERGVRTRVGARFAGWTWQPRSEVAVKVFPGQVRCRQGRGVGR